MSATAWMQMYEITLRGARWGDLEVYSIEENLEILAQPSRKEPPKLVTIVVHEKPVCTPVTVTGPPKKKTFTEKLQMFSKKKTSSCVLQCKSCSYARHTSPPDHFTDEQKSHCCVFCMLTNGETHGSWCQQICA
jgi:hypothetical protein